MQALSGLAGRKTLVQPQLDDLAVGLGKERDDLAQHNEKLLFLGESFGASARTHCFREGNFLLTQATAANIPGGVGDDLTHPGTSLGAVEAGMVDGLENLDPTDLESIFGKAVVSGNPLGEGKEAFRTAGDPFFLFSVQEWTFTSGPLEGAGRNDMQALRHGSQNLIISRVAATRSIPSDPEPRFPYWPPSVCCPVSDPTETALLPYRTFEIAIGHNFFFAKRKKTADDGVRRQW